MTGLPIAVPHRVRGRRVAVDGPLRLAAGGRETAVAVQFLRECVGRGLDAEWTWAADDAGTPDDARTPYDLRVLRHLPPPVERAGEPGELTGWRTGYVYGALYHRRGPDFVTVLDRRDAGTAARLTLDHPDLLAAFDRLGEPTPLDALDAVHREAVGLLGAERLVLVTDGWAVALPPRIRRWPVPCTGI
ncbi:DUF5825 family protein [Streptomyces sp. NPDC005209]|uniref:DUF5825 family protein n=1 Tax=Streptomyces sp. NPDC005209 TaxID=3156715 RepID=UPI0033B160CB